MTPWDSNPQLLQASGRRSSPYTAQPLGPATKVGGQRHDPAILPPGKIRYALYGGLGGPHVRSGRVRKISPPPEFDLLPVQPVASRCCM